MRKYQITIDFETSDEIPEEMVEFAASKLIYRINDSVNDQMFSNRIGNRPIGGWINRFLSNTTLTKKDTPPKGCRLAKAPCPVCRGKWIKEGVLMGGKCPRCGMSSAGGEWPGER